MLTHKPELFYEWDFEKNDKLGLDVFKATYGSKKIVWWKCTECESGYDMTIKARVKFKRGCCPKGWRINNSLASLYPEVASEWHPTKNGNLTPHDVTFGVDLEVWWFGTCGHEWDVKVCNRTTNGHNCPYCSNQKLLIGFNDMWTTNPELASMLLNPEDGYKCTYGSGKKVDWKCLDCGNAIKNKKISDVYYQGVSCPRCSDGIKFPEKFVHNLLRKFNIDFKFDEAQSWAQGRRYDFYFEHEEKTCIIETHGEQHYKEGFKRVGGRSLQEEQENDRYKEKLAKENGIDKYIVIDCRCSTIQWIKSSILNSELIEIIDMNKVDWEETGKISTKSLVKEVCDLWMSGMKSVSELEVYTKLSRATILKYLKRGVEIGWCDYSREESLKNTGKSVRRKVVQLTLDQEYINEWESISDASLSLTGKRDSATHISATCRNKRESFKGFKWMYKEDYDEPMTSQD